MEKTLTKEFVKELVKNLDVKSDNELDEKLDNELFKFSFLFTVDTINESIAEFKKTGKNSKNDEFNNILFLKIPHHGSSTSDELSKKFNSGTCENMICVATTFKNGKSLLPKTEVLDTYLDLENVYCTSDLSAENIENYGIVKSIFEFSYNNDGKFNLEKTTCETYGNAYLYGEKRTSTNNTEETTS